MTKVGRLIVIDGTDWSGKKTQIALLEQHLKDQWYDVEKIDFPQYGHKSAGLVEDYLNGKYGQADEVTPYQGSLFYALDRYEASFTMKKWLAEGKVVLCDRYVSANMWHQAWKIEDIHERDVFLDWVQDLEYNILNIPKPDFNIFLYVDPEMSRNLALKVQKPNMDKAKDIHENSSDHMRKASEAFLYVSKKYGWKQINCILDDKLRWIDDIAQEVLDAVLPIL